MDPAVPQASGEDLSENGSDQSDEPTPTPTDELDAGRGDRAPDPGEDDVGDSDAKVEPTAEVDEVRQPSEDSSYADRDDRAPDPGDDDDLDFTADETDTTADGNGDADADGEVLPGLTDQERAAYDQQQQEDLLRHGTERGLTPEQVADFVKAGAIEKGANPPHRMEPKEQLTPDQLKSQMNNWTNEVSPRGYPYHFDSPEQFEAFGHDIQGLRDQYDLPDGPAVVQGSSLRTPDAKDVDVAIMASDDDFDAYVDRCHDGIAERAGSAAAVNLGNQLDVAADKGFVPAFLADRPAGTTGTFPQAVRSIQDRHGVPGLDVSVMRESSVMALYPNLALPEDQR